MFLLIHLYHPLYNLNFLNVTHNFEQNGADSLFAKPGVKSDSCDTTGILFIEAAITTGTATNPP